MKEIFKYYEDTKVPLKKNNIPYFTGNEQYWTISSGKQKNLYDYFYKNEIIGLAWDKIEINDIIDSNLEEIKIIVENKYASLSSSYNSASGFSRATTIWAKEINYFINEIQLGDIVVVKDKRRKKVMFGKIVSNVFESSEHKKHLYIDKRSGYCNKFFKVKWLKLEEKDNVSELIKNTIYIQQAVSNITDKNTISDINRTIFPLFYCADDIHVIFNVKTENEINFDDYYQFLSYMSSNINKYSDSKDIYIKTNVSSPGPIEFFGKENIIANLLKSLGILGRNPLDSELKKHTKALKITTPTDCDYDDDDGFTRGN